MDRTSLPASVPAAVPLPVMNHPKRTFFFIVLFKGEGTFFFFFLKPQTNLGSLAAKP